MSEASDEIKGLLVMALADMSDTDFSQKLEGDLFAEARELLPLVPAEYKKTLKSLKFAEIKKTLEEELPEKAAIVSKKKKWPQLEKDFCELQKAL